RSCMQPKIEATAARKREELVKQKTRDIILAVKMEYQGDASVEPVALEAAQLQRANASLRAQLGEVCRREKELRSELAAARRAERELRELRQQHEAVQSQLSEARRAERELRELLQQQPEAEVPSEAPHELEAAAVQPAVFVRERAALPPVCSNLASRFEGEVSSSERSIVRGMLTPPFPFSDAFSFNDVELSSLLGGVGDILGDDVLGVGALSDMSLRGLCVSLARLVLRSRERANVQREILETFLECQDRLRESNGMRIKMLEEEVEVLRGELRHMSMGE
ncbi:antigenic protein, partial [Trypanosoma conorhini]